jgi:hypothetical protein
MSGMKKLLAWLLICPVVFAQVPSLDDTLKQAVSGPQALTQAMEPWLDANGFDRLREALKTAKPKTAAEWHGVALLQQGLMDHEAVLAAFKKACGMKAGVTAEMRLSLSRELARSRQFAEALQTSDALETASLDSATARELFWLLAGISTEGDFRSAGLERIRKLAAARPDDLELQTSLIRLERRHGSSSATEQKVREGFEKATGPQARSAWLLLSLEEHSRQGRLVQLIEMALSYLGEIAAGSDDERQALEQVRQVFQNGREDPKLTTRPQDIAAKYPQRPAIVLAMAEILREQGETSEAASLLGSLKDNPQAGRLLAEWAEEDDREEALPPVVPAQVTEVKSAGEVLPEATWRVELASLKEAEVRSGRLIELRRELPDDEELAMAEIEHWNGQQRPAEALHEALRMHHRRAGDEKRLRGWWTSLLQGQAGWAIRQQGLHLPWLANDPAFAMALRTANGRIRPADQMDSALWREVHEALTRGLTRFAARTMLEHADDEALDAELAGRLAVGLMASRAWKDAAAFLGLQQVRFPKNYRLAFLHGMALEGHGDAAGAEKVFLSLGGFTQETSFETTQQPFSRHGIHIPPDTRDDPWTAISQAVELSTRFSQMLAQWREQSAYSSSDSWRVLPPTVKAAGAWGMVQLLEIAAKRDGPGREDLARRAREAGLPLPELLVAGSLASQSTDGYSAYTRLELDEAWLLEHVELEWAAQALLRQLQMRMFRGRPLTPEEKAKDARTAREAAGRLMDKSPRLALQAALQAWQLMPEAAMPPEVPVAVGKAGAESEGLLSSTLPTLPLEARRKAAAVLLPLVVAQAGKEGLSENQKASIGTSALWLGGWKEAASLVAGLKQPVPVQAPVPAWAMMHATSPLSWPPQAWPWFYETSLRWLPETEKAAFLEAGTLLPASSLRIAWLHAGGDAPRAEQEVKAWIKAEPDSKAAVLAMASLLMQDKKPDEALDLLHRHATSQKDAEQRRMALRLYLQAAFFPGQGPSVSMYNERGRSRLPPPPEKHEKRLRQAATELLPEVRRQTSQWSDAWQSVFQALNLAKDAPTQRARFEASYWTGDQNARDELEDSRNRRRERQSVHSYGIKRLLEAKKKPQAIELMLRQFRRDADQRFSGPAGRMEAGQMEEWRQLITQEGLAAELIKEAAPRQPDDSRRLAQAVHVAEICGDWAQAVTWAEAALKLDPDLPWMKLALASARQQLSGDPAVLVAVVRDLPPAEAKAAVLALLQQAQRSADFPHRLAVAQAALDVLSKHPGVLEPEGVMRDGVRIQTLSGSANPPSEVLRQLFELLTQAVQDREGKRVAEGLHPGWSTYRQSSQGDSAKAATPALLDRRKTIHAQLCELALKHPEWAETALRPLTGRHLIEGVPSKDELLAYGRKALKALPGRGPSLIQTWTGQGAPADAALRFRLAALVIPLLEEAWQGVQNPYPSQTGLVELIGAEIPAPQFPPLWALWECPLDVKEGKFVHTKEQLALNKQRREVMDQLWQATQTIPGLRQELFPSWAAYRLHFLNQPDEVLAAMRKLKSASTADPYLLRALLSKAVLSYENSHHILSAEVLTALLQEDEDLLPKEVPAREIEQFIEVLLQGRKDQADPMPTPTTPEEESKHLLGESWHTRRVAVLARLTQFLGGRIPLPLTLHFMELQKALLAGQDTQDIEQRIIQLAADRHAEAGKRLDEMIWTARGRGEYDQGYSGGIWDLKRRLEWFAAALRIGRSLLSSPHDSGDNDVWLSGWIYRLSEPNKLCDPVVPPLLGRERQAEWHHLPPADHAAEPLLAKREQMVMEGLEIAMRRPRRWAQHLAEYTHLQITRHGAAGVAKVRDILDMHARERPESLIEGFRTWADPADFPMTEACVAVADLLVRHLDRLPENAVTNQWLEGWKRIVIGLRDSDEVRIPLLPEKSWMTQDTSRQGGRDNVDRNLLREGSKERLTAWLRILEKMEGIPAMAALTFGDQARLHVENGPERIMKMASRFDDNQWFQAEQAMVRLYTTEEAMAPASRRAAWGRLALLWQPESAKRHERVSGHPQPWAGKTLDFLRRGHVMPLEKGRRPASHDELDEMARKLGDLLLADPASSTGGFVLFARKEHAAQAAPAATLKLARQVLAKKPASLSIQLEDWCRAIGGKEGSTAERAWAGGVLVDIAEDWPANHGAEWLRAAVSMLEDSTAKKDDDASRLTEHLERLVELAFGHLRVAHLALPGYARHACSTSSGSQKLVRLVTQLAATDLAAAGAAMRSWWSLGGLSAWSGSFSTEAQGRTAIEILRQWPAKAPQESLQWVEGLVFELGPPVPSFSTRMIRTANGAEMEKNLPAPALDAPRRQIQTMALQELEKRQITPDWAPGMAMRLAARGPADAAADTLRPFFTKDNFSSTLDTLHGLLLVNLDHTMGSHWSGKDDPPPHRGAQRVLDTVGILQTAAREKWLTPDQTTALEQTARTHLQTIITRARETENTMKRFSWPEAEAVRPAQGVEAARLLRDWETLPLPPSQASITPAGLPAALHSLLRENKPATHIANRVLELLAKEPAPASKALEEWALQLRNRMDFEVFLRAGPVARALAERWTQELPTPEWLPAFASSWSENSSFTDAWTPARIESYRAAAAQVLPMLHRVLRQYPGCRPGAWFDVVCGYALRKEKLGEAEIAALALAHLRAQPRGSMPAVSLPSQIKSPSRLHGPDFHRDAWLFLLDFQAAAGDLEWWRRLCQPVAAHALSRDAKEWHQALEQLATCPPESFLHAAQRVHRSNRNSGSGSLQWVLRTAARRKLEISPEMFLKLVPELVPFRAEDSYHVWQASLLWLRSRLHEGHDAVEDMRMITREVLGPDLTGAVLRQAFQAHAATGNKWYGWPHGSSPLAKLKPASFVHNLLESLSQSSPGHLRAVAAVSRDLGLEAIPGCVGRLFTLPDNGNQPVEDAHEWQRIITASSLLDGMPDELWLTPVDGCAPVWEFAAKLGLHRFTAAAPWLEEKMREKPSVGTALLLLAARRQERQNIETTVIENALAPMWPQIEKATPEQRGILSAALHIVQPDLRRHATTGSVLRLLPTLPGNPAAAASIASNWLSRTSSGTSSSDKVSQRLLPLAADVLRLIEAGETTAHDVARHGIRLLAAEDWLEKPASEMTREEWLWEYLGKALMEQTDPAGRPEDSGSVRRLEALCRYLLQHAENHTALLGSQVFTGRLVSSVVFPTGTARTIMDLKDILLRLIPEDAGPRTMLLLPVMLRMPGASVEATLPAEKRGSWLSWCLLHKGSPTIPPPGPPQDGWPPVLLMKHASLYAGQLSQAQRTRALHAWARTTSWMDDTASESHFEGRAISWLADTSRDPALDEAVTGCAAAMTRWLRSPRRSWITTSLGGDFSVATTTIQPLLHALKRAGRLEMHRDLLRAAAVASRLRLDDLLEELRDAPDTTMACAELLPLYFHADMNQHAKTWRYDAKHLPSLIQGDERILDAIQHAGFQDASERAALMVLAALPDDAGSPPSEPRSVRVQKAVQEMDPSITEHLAACDLVLGIPGLAAQLLEELLPMLGRHPAMTVWRQDSRLSTDESLATSSTMALHALVITLGTAGEALQSGDASSWKKWAASLAESTHAQASEPRFAGSVAGFLRPNMRWSFHACSTLALLCNHWESSRHPNEWPRLLPLWDALPPEVLQAYPYDHACHLRIAIALSKNSPEGRAEARQHLTRYRWSRGGVKLALQLALRCELTLPERVKFLASSSPPPETSMHLIHDAAMEQLITLEHWQKMIAEEPPESLLPLARGLIGWLGNNNHKTTLASLARRFASIDAQSLNASDWMAMANATDEKTLQANLKAKSNETTRK